MQNGGMARKDYAAIAVRQRTGREPEDLVRELYVEGRYSQREIAAALDVDRDVISRWMRKYGITRDDREAIAL